MRLINVKTFQLQEFYTDVPAYAILSHTWGESECTLHDMDAINVSSKKRYAKIRYCCEQALKDGLKWAWVDT